MTPYLSIDIETTGLDSELCEIIEVAMVYEDWLQPIHALPYFHCYVPHKKGFHAEPMACAMNADIMRIIAQPDKHPDKRFVKKWELLAAMAEFVKSMNLDPMHVVAGGKNFGGFDRQFLQNCEGYGRHINFKHRCIDPAMLYWNPKEDECPPSTNQCLERAGFPNRTTHRALDDALDVISLVRSHHGVKC